MAKRKEPPQILLDPEKWYAIAFGKKPFREECCDCGLVHEIDYKLENGVFYARYKRDEPATRMARRRMVRKGMKMPTLPTTGAASGADT
jgi:hypothetical protein